MFGGGKRRDAEVGFAGPVVLLLIICCSCCCATKDCPMAQTPQDADHHRSPHVVQVTERSRQEVAFWKNQLDHAVEEKNALLDRYTALYRHAYELEQYAVQLGTENNELQHVLEQTLSDERRVQVSAAGLRASLTSLSSPRGAPGGGAAGAAGSSSSSTSPVSAARLGGCWVVVCHAQGAGRGAAVDQPQQPCQVSAHTSAEQRASCVCSSSH